MFTIRATQVEALREVVRRSFTEEMVLHLEQFAPRLAAVAGREGLERTVREGIARALRYQLTKRGPVRSFLELRVWLGAEFDTDPLLPWAGAILRDADAPDQVVRSSRLHETAKEYLERVWGDDGQSAIAALRRLKEVRFEDLPPPGQPDYPGAALATLRRTYPEKCDEVGADALARVVRQGVESSRAFEQVPSTLGAGLFAALGFALGHGCERDPLYPWIAGALNDPRVAEPARRLERLHARTRTYLDHALEHYELEAASGV